MPCRLPCAAGHAAITISAGTGAFGPAGRTIHFDGFAKAGIACMALAKAKLLYDPNAETHGS